MSEPLYSDHLVTLTRETITFERYYFPFGGSKTVALDRIERVAVHEPGLRSGKWRLHGTGDFRHWFPMDMARPTRDRIFVAFIEGQRLRIGFTAVDGARVEGLLRDLGLVR